MGLLNDYDILETEAKLSDIKWELDNIPENNIIVLYQVWYDIFTHDFKNLTCIDKAIYLDVFKETFICKPFEFTYLPLDQIYVIYDATVSYKKQTNLDSLIDSIKADYLILGDDGKTQDDSSIIDILMYHQLGCDTLKKLLKRGVFRVNYKYIDIFINSSKPFIVKSNYDKILNNINKIVSIKKEVH